MQCGFTEVDGRCVLYRRSGAGPPIVMLHGSPGDGAMLRSEIAAAAEHFTVFALDTPGFGNSAPIPGDILTVEQLARATASAMDALKLPPCPIYGTHTGALIAVELGACMPERITGIIAEGLPIFTETEMAELFDGYFEPMVADPLGRHLTATFIRFRDQFTWFPWLSRDVERLNPVDRPTPQEIDLWVNMFFRSCKTYHSAYRAACYHGSRAFTAASRLTVPTIFMASEEDMLFEHLQRLPPLRPEQRIVQLPYDPASKYGALVDLLTSLPQANALAPLPPKCSAGHDPAVRFVNLDGMDVFVRSFGRLAMPAIILLHDAPGSGQLFEATARDLADEFFVIVPDLPANGLSGAPKGPVIEASANAVLAIATAFSLKTFGVGALGCGCAVAAVLAQRGDERLSGIVLEALPRNCPKTAAAIAPDLSLTPEGSHWIKAWLMVRDSQIYDPWFAGTVAAQRKTQGNFGAEWLHDQTVEIMKARETYHLLPRAAWSIDTEALLGQAPSKLKIIPAASGELALSLRALFSDQFATK